MSCEEHICQENPNKERIRIEKDKDKDYWWLKEVSWGHDCWGRSEDQSRYIKIGNHCPYCGKELSV